MLLHFPELKEVLRRQVHRLLPVSSGVSVSNINKVTSHQNSFWKCKVYEQFHASQSDIFHHCPKHKPLQSSILSLILNTKISIWTREETNVHISCLLPDLSAVSSRTPFSDHQSPVYFHPPKANLLLLLVWTLNWTSPWVLLSSTALTEGAFGLPSLTWNEAWRSASILCRLRPSSI